MLQTATASGVFQDREDDAYDVLLSSPEMERVLSQPHSQPPQAATKQAKRAGRPADAASASSAAGAARQNAASATRDDDDLAVYEPKEAVTRQEPPARRRAAQTRSPQLAGAQQGGQQAAASAWDYPRQAPQQREIVDLTGDD